MDDDLNLDLPLPDPEVEESEELEHDEVMAFTLQNASIGDVLLVRSDVALPDDWHECDGSAQHTRLWPDFAAELGIRAPSFHLPEADLTPPGRRFVVKLGLPADHPLS